MSADLWEAWLEYLLPPPPSPPTKTVRMYTSELNAAVAAIYETDRLMAGRPSFMDSLFGGDDP